MQLQPNGMSRERPTCQPRAIAFFDPPFAPSALLVKDNHALGRAAHVYDDEADVFARADEVIE